VTNPFAALGLPARPDLTDEQVRAAWRAIAAATHPDQPGGGDPARYTAASAAYATLRTGWGRSEAYADLISQTPPPARTLYRPPRGGLLRSFALAPVRVRHGRPLRLAVRALAAVLLGVVAVRSGASEPAVAGVVTGLGAWLILTMRGDLAPPPGR
jgi:curved DNA-binding protein CbpA